MKTYPDSGTAEAERAASGDGFECGRCYASVKELSDSGNCEACELALADDRVADMLAVIAGPHEPERVELKDGGEVAKFIGWQETMDPTKPLALFNATQQVGIHPINGTIGAETLELYGYSAPSTAIVYRHVDDGSEHGTYKPASEL